MASAEPTIEEAAAIKTMGDALTWAGYTEEDFSQTDSPINILMRAIGQKRTSSIRIIANMNAEDLKLELEDWKVDGRRPDLSQRSQAHLAIKAARIAAGTAWRWQEEKAQADAEAEHQRALQLIEAETARAQAMANVQMATTSY